MRTRPGLIRNEQNEAAAFDRLADRSDKRTLKTSAWTFSRYRSAVMGRPFYNAFPDRLFVYIGRHFHQGRGKDRPLQGVRVFDLGAGDGVWSVIFADLGAEVTSVDISPGQVDRALERMRMHELFWDARVGSAYHLRDQFPGASFDLIFGRVILHHLTWDLERVYNGVHYLLRDKGRALMTEPYCASPLLRRLREQLAWIIPLNRESPDERPLNDEDLLPLCGLFSDVTMERYDLLARFARRIVRSARLQRAVFDFDRRILQNKMFRNLASGIFVAARK